MGGLVEVFLVVFLVFAGTACLLVVVQRMSKKPLPVGCTPVDGQCCRQSGTGSVCTGERLRTEPMKRLEVHDAGA